jgi:hypothetical protein
MQNIKKTLCLVICDVFLLSPIKTQEVSTQQQLSDTITINCNKTHEFRTCQILIPGLFITTSALCVNNGWLQERRNEVQRTLAAATNRRTEWDNYVQYLPILEFYGLNMCGIKGVHNPKDKTILLAMSYLYMGVMVNAMKYTFREPRPGNGSRNSFPSGHTATAFMGAELLNQEYKVTSPWIGYSGYATAAIIGYMRMYNNRHYINDVVAGAAIGILSTKLAYWTYPLFFKRHRYSAPSVVGSPILTNEFKGLDLCLTF